MRFVTIPKLAKLRRWWEERREIQRLEVRYEIAELINRRLEVLYQLLEDKSGEYPLEADYRVKLEQEFSEIDNRLIFWNTYVQARKLPYPQEVIDGCLEKFLSVPKTISIRVI